MGGTTMTDFSNIGNSRITIGENVAEETEVVVKFFNVVVVILLGISLVACGITVVCTTNRPPAPKHVSHQSTPRAQSVLNFKN